jgi:3-deoxy-D-manno-octulosonic-acid transferase
VLAAFLIVRQRCPQAKLILVPRHPVRAMEVMELARGSVERVQRFSAVNAKEPWEVLVVDAMGVLALVFHVASAAFVGGSLVPKGGQNPLESAAAGCPVWFGPDMSDFPDISQWLMDAGAAGEVRDADELGRQWVRVLEDLELRERMRSGCRQVVQVHCGTTAVVVDDILSRLGGR